MTSPEAPVAPARSGAAVAAPRRRTWLDTAHAIYHIPTWVAWTIVVFPIAGFLFLFTLLIIPATNERGTSLLVEDHAVENFTPVGYWIATIIGGVYARWLWRRHRRTLALLIAFVALANFGCGGEEISWGQRLFHWKTPATFARENIQGETTVHNLAIFEGIINYMPVAVGTLGLVLIAAHTRRRRDLAGVPSILAACFWTIAIQNAYDNFTDWVPIDVHFDTIIAQIGEYSEMLVAWGFATGLALAFRRELFAERDRLAGDR
jgi:hypothetical protein